MHCDVLSVGWLAVHGGFISIIIADTVVLVRDTGHGVGLKFKHITFRINNFTGGLGRASVLSDLNFVNSSDWVDFSLSSSRP
jgi:hypothetical protein